MSKRLIIQLYNFYCVGKSNYHIVWEAPKSKLELFIRKTYLKRALSGAKIPDAAAAAAAAAETEGEG